MFRQKILTLLILVVFLPPSVIGSANESSGTLTNNSDSYGFSYVHTIPLLYKETNGLNINSKINHRILDYQRSWKNGLSVNITFQNDNQEFSVEDTSELVLQLRNHKQNRIGIAINKASTVNTLSLKVGLLETMELDQISLEYDHHIKYLSLHAGIQLQRRPWGLTLIDASHEVPISTSYNQSQLSVQSVLKVSKFKLLAGFEKSLPYRLPAISNEAIEFELNPHRIAYQFALSTVLAEKIELTIFHNEKSDTLNSDIMKLDKRIGELYAFDLKTRTTGIKMERADNRIALEHHKLHGRISGSVIAAYFSNMLSQLSGARYFQQMEVNVEYVKFSTVINKTLFQHSKLSIHNSIMGGSGSLYSKHYVFLYFNPLVDLSIQELKFHTFVIDQINIEYQMNLNSNIQMGMGINYLLPLYLDWEAKPSMDIVNAESYANSSASIELKYLFD